MKKRRELKNDKLEHFVHSVFIIISKVFFLDIYIDYTLQELFNGTKNTQIVVQMTKL